MSMDFRIGELDIRTQRVTVRIDDAAVLQMIPTLPGSKLTFDVC